MATKEFPREIAYPGRREGESGFVFDPRRKAYQLSSSSSQLLQFGDLKRGAHRLRVEIGQPRWGSPVGVFLGYRSMRLNGVDRAEFQIIKLAASDRDAPNAKLRITREIAMIQLETATLTMKRPLAEAQVLLPLGSEPCELVLELDEQGMKSVTWDKVELTELSTAQANGRLTDADYLGPWGVFNFEGAPFVRDLTEVQQHK
jgi:hypothetical protein